MSEDLGEIVSLLNLGITQSAIYFRGHPRLAETVSELSAKLGARRETESPDGLFLGVVDARLVYGGKPLLGPTLIAKRLIEAAKRMRCGGFLFQSAVTAEDLKEWFAVCAEAKRSVSSLDEARRLLTSRGVTGIALSPPYGEPGWLGDAVVVPGVGAVSTDDVVQVVQSVPMYQSLLETVETAHGAAEGDRAPDVGAARSLAETCVRSLKARPANLFHLARYPDYHSYTTGHSVRVALFVALVAHHVGLSEDMVVELATAGLLHDVGKGKIPYEILYKRGRLDDDEKRVMAGHTTLGADVLIQTPEASALAVQAAFSHHIRHDRRGYPTIAPWLEPTRLTFLLQVCDVFEALTAVRPYKPSLTPQRAYEIMLQDHAAFDPVAFRTFVAAIGLYPPGSRVRLNTGEQGLVLSAGRHMARPTVELTHDVSGRVLPMEGRPVVALDDDPARRGVAELIRDDEATVAVPAVDYEDRPTTVVFRDCRHDGAAETCSLCG